MRGGKERRETTSEGESSSFCTPREEGAQVTNDDPLLSSWLMYVLYLTGHGPCIRPCCLLYCPKRKGGYDYSVTWCATTTDTITIETLTSADNRRSSNPPESDPLFLLGETAIPRPSPSLLGVLLLAR